MLGILNIITLISQSIALLCIYHIYITKYRPTLSAVNFALYNYYGENVYLTNQ